MIFIWGNTLWAVWTNGILAAGALIFGLVEAARFRTFWGLAAAAFFLVSALTSEWARRRSVRAGALLAEEARRERQERRCPDCGHLNQSGWSFCSDCGVRRDQP